MGHYQKGVYAFDCDGVLTDTAKSHITFCNDINIEFKFGLPEINPENRGAVKKVLANPMSSLLQAYGFPIEEIPRLDEIYVKRFAGDPRYQSKPFPGVEPMLGVLRRTGRFMMILSSNTRRNVSRDLGNRNMKHFDRVLTKEELEKYDGMDKGHALNRVIWTEFDAIPGNAVIYVGDMQSDLRAAQTSGARFLPVNYGWGTWDKQSPQAVNSVKELTEKLLKAFD